MLYYIKLVIQFLARNSKVRKVNIYKSVNSINNSNVAAIKAKQVVQAYILKRIRS